MLLYVNKRSSEISIFTPVSSQSCLCHLWTHITSMRLLHLLVNHDSPSQPTYCIKQNTQLLMHFSAFQFYKSLFPHPGNGAMAIVIFTFLKEIFLVAQYAVVVVDHWSAGLECHEKYQKQHVLIFCQKKNSHLRHQSFKRKLNQKIIFNTVPQTFPFFEQWPIPFFLPPIVFYHNCKR